MPDFSEDTINFYACDTCQTEFTRRGQLNRHLRIHDDPSTWFPCDNCTYKSSQKSNVTNHARAKHDKRQKIIPQRPEPHPHNDLAQARHSTNKQPDAGPSGATSTADALNHDQTVHQQIYDSPPGLPPHLGLQLQSATPALLSLSPIVHPPVLPLPKMGGDPTVAEGSTTLPSHDSTQIRVYDPPQEPPPGFEPSGISYGIRWSSLPSSLVSAPCSHNGTKTYLPPPGPPPVMNVSIPYSPCTSLHQSRLRLDQSGKMTCSPFGWLSPGSPPRANYTNPTCDEPTARGRYISIPPPRPSRLVKNNPCIHHRPVNHMRPHAAQVTEAAKLDIHSVNHLVAGSSAVPGELGSLCHPRLNNAENNPFTAFALSHASALPQPSALSWHIGLFHQQGLVNGTSMRAGSSVTRHTSFIRQPMNTLSTPALANATAHSALAEDTVHTFHSGPLASEDAGTWSPY